MTLAQRINGWTRKVPAWPIYVLGALPPVWYFYMALSGQVPGEPVKVIEREIGKLGLQILIGVLAITPIRDFLGVNLIKFRRALGVTGFFYILLHFTVWLVLDMQSLSLALTNIARYYYIMVGLTALTLLLPLALTSNNWSIKRLSPARWKKLHKLTYPAVLLGGLHYLLLVKVPLEPILYLIGIGFLLLLRVKLRRIRVPA